MPKCVPNCFWDRYRRTRRSAIGQISYPDLPRVKQSEIWVRVYYWPSSSLSLVTVPEVIAKKKKIVPVSKWLDGFSKVAETCAHLGEGSLVRFCCQINERVPRKNATNFLSLPKFLPITGSN